jgi:DNA invertase Pin-like site-specific DNA recombinase
LHVKKPIYKTTAGKGMSKRIGYARVLTDDKNLDLQCNALARSGCATTYEETASGKSSLQFHVFAALDEFEPNLIRKRTLACLRAARARSRVGLPQAQAQ